jgi:SOS-response transcriptional repressor LexA
MNEVIKMPYNTARKYYEGIRTRKDIYLYIIRYLKEHDYPPSIPEIAAGLSISNHTVQNHFGELLESGLLETDNPGTPRAYRVTGYKFRKVKEK